MARSIPISRKRCSMLSRKNSDPSKSAAAIRKKLK